MERLAELGGVARQGKPIAWTLGNVAKQSGGEIKESPVVGPDLEFTISVRAGSLSLIEKQGHKRDSSK